jgi:hypothetical protein
LQKTHQLREAELANVRRLARIRGGDIPGFEAVQLINTLFDTMEVRWAAFCSAGAGVD